MIGNAGQITVAAVGKLKRREWSALQDDYLQRMRRYSKVRLVEVKDVVGRSVPDAVAVEREGQRLLAATEDASRRILLSADGNLYSSPQLAKMIGRQIEIYGDLAFLVGGPLGFSTEVVAAANARLSLSPLTFPHEFARILFLEQLYRAFTIQRGQSYHK